MHKKTFENFDIEYNDCDLEYIDLVTEHLIKNEKEIMNFFNIEKLNRKVQIKYWDDLEDYRIYVHHKVFKSEYQTSPWDIGRAINNENESIICMLSYKERLKIAGHEKSTIYDMQEVLLHEFVHLCHLQFREYKPSVRWFSEGLATVLAKNTQFDKDTVDCTLEALLNFRVKYYNYYGMVKYLFENYDHEYILKLAKDKEFLLGETEKIYSESKNYYHNKKNNSI
jgi:hypothetical protein